MLFSSGSLPSAWHILVSGLLVITSFGAHASPAEPVDAVSKLLADKGLLPTSAVVNGSTGINTLPGGSSSSPTALVERERNDLASFGVGFGQQVRDHASDMVISAMNFLGVPYRRGGNSESTGFDCSGFTRHIFELSLGLVLPRRADEQANAPGMLKIDRNELKPGDLVFFNTMRRTFSHVGIYVGDEKFIHSPSAGGRVRVENMREAYWQKRFTGARRAEVALVSGPQAQATAR